MESPPCPRASRHLPLLLAALLPFLGAWRPYETADGTSTPPGLVAVEWGVATVGLHEHRMTLALPELLARVGVSNQIEAGVRGSYRMTMPRGQTPWEGSVAAGDLGIYGKWVLISGAMQNPSWVRPSVALLGGASFLSAESLWSLDARVTGSLFIGPVLLHANLGFHQNRTPGVIAGAVIAMPLSFGLTPAIELSGEVRFGTNPSIASVLFGLSQGVRGLPLSIDLAVRRGITAGSPEWLVTTGVTMQLRVWQPR